MYSTGSIRKSSKGAITTPILGILTETSTALQYEVPQNLQQNGYVPVSNSVLLKHAYMIMRIGPNTGSKSAARVNN